MSKNSPVWSFCDMIQWISIFTLIEVSLSAEAFWKGQPSALVPASIDKTQHRIFITRLHTEHTSSEEFLSADTLSAVWEAIWMFFRAKKAR